MESYDSLIDSGFTPIPAKPIINGRIPPPSTPTRGRALVGTIPTEFQLESDFAENQYGGQVPSYRLMPPATSGKAAVNSAAQSTQIVVQEASKSSGAIALQMPPQYVVRQNISNGLETLSVKWATETANLFLASPTEVTALGFDQATSGFDNVGGAGITTPSLTPTETGEFAIMLGGTNGSVWTVPAGWTSIESGSGNALVAWMQNLGSSQAPIAGQVLTTSGNIPWILSLFLFQGGSSTPTFIQSAGAGSTLHWTQPFASNVTKGNLLFAAFVDTGETANPGTTSFTDTQGNTYTKLYSVANSAGMAIQHVFIAIANATGPNTMTFHFTGTISGFAFASVFEISGIQTTGIPTFREIVTADLQNAPADGSDLGAIQLAGDLGNTATAPEVLSTHLTNPLPLTQGGTGANLNGTGGAHQFVKQSAAGAALTVGTIAGADLPNPTATTLGGVESAGPTTHEWINEIDTSGVPHLSQPTEDDILDTATYARVRASELTSGYVSARTAKGAILSYGPTHYWPCEDTSGLDIGGSPATLNNSGTISLSGFISPPGDARNGLRAGTNTSSAYAIVGKPTTWAAFGWIFFPSGTPASVAAVFGKSDVAPGGTITNTEPLCFVDTSGFVYGAVNANGTKQIVKSSYAPNWNVIHHIGVAFGSDNFLRLYIDGKADNVLNAGGVDAPGAANIFSISAANGTGYPAPAPSGWFYGGNNFSFIDVTYWEGNSLSNAEFISLFAAYGNAPPTLDTSIDGTTRFAVNRVTAAPGGSPTIGTVDVDTTNNKIWVFTATGWKGVTIT